MKCIVEGCDKNTRGGRCPYCEMHYGRLRRNGTLDRVLTAHTREHSGGYILVPAHGHPLAHGGSLVYEHRAVYYDAHGEGPFKCHWCGKDITWSTLHIDHLNDSKKDNRLSNLVASCPACNKQRGHHKMLRTTREKRATWIEYEGKRQTLLEWAQQTGIGRTALQYRLANGWPLDRALTEPRGKSGPMAAASR